MSEESSFQIAIVTQPDGEVQMRLVVRHIPSKELARLLADNLAGWLTEDGTVGWSKRVN